MLSTYLQIDRNRLKVVLKYQQSSFARPWKGIKLACLNNFYRHVAKRFDCSTCGLTHNLANITQK